MPVPVSAVSPSKSPPGLLNGPAFNLSQVATVLRARTAPPAGTGSALLRQRWRCQTCWWHMTSEGPLSLGSRRERGVLGRGPIGLLRRALHGCSTGRRQVILSARQRQAVETLAHL